MKLAEADRHLWKKYGLTRAEWRQMLADQEDKCAICRVDLDPEPQTRQNGGVKVCVDHDHLTGKVRGILCDFCNKGIGSFHDDIGLMEAAISYLKESGT